MPKINKEEYEVLKELNDKWKWIARDKDRSLYAFTEKPVRKYDPSPYWDTETEGPYTALELIDEIHLFQFIQWEDEEPHNIAELIREYEFENKGFHNKNLGIWVGLDNLQHADNDTSKLVTEESEETEVKKDIEWFMEQMKSMTKMRDTDSDEESWYISEDALLEALVQLDEPEVLSQEWISEKSIDTHVDTVNGEIQVTFILDDLQNLLVPEQEEPTHAQVQRYLSEHGIEVVELPVIPKFVAKWISEHHERFDWYPAVKRLENNAMSWEEVYEWYRKNTSKFANAYLTGKYEVEKDQKYILSINITDKASKTNYETFLNKRGIFHSMENEFNSEEFNWSEEEIKGLESGEILFEHFATRVEELEE